MTIIIDPQSSGIAGNMIIGALVDLGANKNELKEIMEKSAEPFGKVDVSFSKVAKHGIDSTFCHVEMLEHKDSIKYPQFIEKINTFQGRYKYPEITSIKGAMAFMARMFYSYPISWANSLFRRRFW